MNIESLFSLRARRQDRNARAFSWLVALAIGIGAISAASHAQDSLAGKRLYENPGVQGYLSCSASNCHGSDPTANLNRVRSAANFPGAITFATETVPEMVFLRGRYYASELVNLAAYIGDPRQNSQQPTATLSVTSITFDPVNLGTTSSLRIVTITNNGLVPLQLSSITINTNEFARTFGNCAPIMTIQPYGSCSMGIAFTPATAGLRTATLTLTHNAALGRTTLPLSGTGNVSGDASTRTMIEYRNAALDYYFMTSRVTDVALLDSLVGWSRTGQSFKVHASSVVGTTAINRYFADQIAFRGSRGTHFYTVVASEKAGLELFNPYNLPAPGLPYNEGIDSYAFAPLVDGIGGYCAQGQTPVYRLFRGPTAFPDNANHRFTTDVVLYSNFVALGWDGEGVKICVPN